MSDEAAFIDLLKTIATDPAARGLMDDAAVFVPPAGRALVLTHDMLVEGVHYLPDDPPGDVAWKLVAVNLSDLAAKGARPEDVLLGYMLGADRAWDAAFVEGLAAVTARFGVRLLGGDTVAATGGPRALGLTAIGSVVSDACPARSGARPGDGLWVTGTIGDAGAGLALASAGQSEPASLIDAYRRPVPRVAEGQLLIPCASASADISDGLLIDAQRIATASGCAVEIALEEIPLSAALIALRGGSVDVRLAAATGGDDYELLMAVPPARTALLLERAGQAGIHVRRVGGFRAGSGLTLTHHGRPVALPKCLGYQHGATEPDDVA